MTFANHETRLHCAAVDYLRAVCPDCLLWHTPNGGKRSKETARLMKRLGTLPGVFDLILVDPGGRHFYLEAKSAKGTLSDDQDWFKRELILRGIPYVVFRSLDDLRDFIVQNRIPNRMAEMYEPALRNRLVEHKRSEYDTAATGTAYGEKSTSGENVPTSSTDISGPTASG